MSLQWRVIGAVLGKDLRCAFPAVLLAVAVFGGDVVAMRLELWPFWESLRQPLVLLSAALLVFAVFQLDSPVSQVDDWLCRPVPRRELVLAKGGLVLAVVYGSRVLATLVVDLVEHRPAGETVADAVLLQDEFSLLLLAVLWMIAITTRTTVQAIGALVGVFVAVFLLPTAFMTSPGPTRPDVGELLLMNGMGWMVSAPSKGFAVVATIVCCGLVYRFRCTSLARAWLAFSVLAALVIFLVPMFHLPWRALAAVQARAIPHSFPDAPSLGRISLLTRRACFPSARLSSVGDGDFGAMRQAARLPWWPDSELRGAGPDSIAFVTSFQPRGVPRDWSVQLAYAQAEYRSADGAHRVDLRPARYESATPGAFTHAWLLPNAALQNLEGAAPPTATFHYTFALLRPREHSLPTDGVRRRLEGLGYCGASAAASSHTIEVDCLVTDADVAQLSARLASIAPTAVSSRLDLGPAWLRWSSARRMRLTIPSARLSNEDHIEVSAWEPAGFIERRWSSRGVLGDAESSCPLPESGAGRVLTSRWRDAAPHETQRVVVDAGVSLEVLDFGGEGPPLLLVPGLGATGHSFDTLAPRLAKHHRVLAMTRRGSGASSRVDFGYDTPRLARDIIALLDALDIPKALIVGHSIAGDELTWLGAHHADRVSGLVYLDAAYDRSVRTDDSPLQDLQLRLPPEPPAGDRDWVDYPAFRAMQARRLGSPLPEGELIAFYQAGKPFLAGIPDIDARVAAAIPAALKRPDYRSLKVPVLALYATLDEAAPIKPWLDRNDPEQMNALREIGVITQRMKQASIDQLRTEAPDATIVELKGADHWIFLSHEQEVVDAIGRFTATKRATEDEARR